MSSRLVTHYDILGILPSASPAEIDAAYRHIVTEFDPEHLPPGAFPKVGARTRVKEAKASWDVLSNWQSRALYDESIGVIPLKSTQRAYGPARPAFDSSKSTNPFGEDPANAKGFDRGDRKNEPPREQKPEGQKPGWFSGGFFGWGNQNGGNPKNRQQNDESEPDSDVEHEIPEPQSEPFHRHKANTSEFRDRGRGKARQEEPAPAADEVPAKEPPTYEEAASRYMETETGTIMDIVISKWRLQLHISSKFRFLNDVSELSSPRDGGDKIAFKIGLAYNKDSPEFYETTMNELTIHVDRLPNFVKGIPGPNCGIEHVKTIFKESLSDMPTLVISMQAEPNFHPAGGLNLEQCIPWKFGFDFDFNQGVMSHRKGTCLIFSRHSPPRLYKGFTGRGSPEYELMNDEGVNANRFRDLEDEKMVKMKYGEEVMWRMAAVGWKG